MKQRIANKVYRLWLFGKPRHKRNTLYRATRKHWRKRCPPDARSLSAW